MSLKYIEFKWLGNLLLMRRWVWNAYSIIILADNCGCGVICNCEMSKGHCCILGTTLSRVFWQLTTPLKLTSVGIPLYYLCLFFHSCATAIHLKLRIVGFKRRIILIFMKNIGLFCPLVYNMLKRLRYGYGISSTYRLKRNMYLNCWFNLFGDFLFK